MTRSDDNWSRPKPRQRDLKPLIWRRLPSDPVTFDVIDLINENGRVFYKTIRVDRPNAWGLSEGEGQENVS